ncbi:MAG: GIY-YIG nuclease family protein [Candidatus Caccosoma sp.]|nr:GIY-YIG nuclease family protein [Candidatus Caccosoma sp.]
MENNNLCGVIYILTNPSFPEYVKIGYADDVTRRLKELNRSECVPFAFRLFAYYEVSNRLSDKKIHEMIDRLNPNLRSIDEFDGKKRVREFYAMDAEEAYSLLEAIAEINGLKANLHRVAPTKEEVKEYELAECVRAESFKFSMCNLNVGDEIEFIGDSNIKCTICGEKKVMYNNEEYSLSSLAKILTGKSYSLAGPHYFSYKGEKLCDMRERLNKR